jgi:hypothetical protein
VTKFTHYHMWAEKIRARTHRGCTGVTGCQSMVWTSREDWEEDRRQRTGDHQRWSHCQVLSPEQFTTEYEEVTCLMCLVRQR